MKRKVKVILVLFSTILLVSCGGCAVSKSNPEATIKKFEKTYNDMDFEGMQNCLDKGLNSAVDGGKELGKGYMKEMTGGMDLSSLYSMIPLLQNSGMIQQYMDEYGISYHLDIEVLDSQVEESKAYVNSVLHLQTTAFSQSENVDQPCMFILSYNDEEKEWKISGVGDPENYK